jgi:hypothetical protein
MTVDFIGVDVPLVKYVGLFLMTLCLSVRRRSLMKASDAYATSVVCSKNFLCS